MYKDCEHTYPMPKVYEDYFGNDCQLALMQLINIAQNDTKDKFRKEGSSICEEFGNNHEVKMTYSYSYPTDLYDKKSVNYGADIQILVCGKIICLY